MEKDNSIPVAEEMVFDVFYRFGEVGRGCGICHYAAYMDKVSLDEAVSGIIHHFEGWGKALKLESTNTKSGVATLQNILKGMPPAQAKAHYIRLIYRAGKVPRYVSDGTVIPLPPPAGRIQLPSASPPTRQEFKPTYTLSLTRKESATCQTS